MVVRKKKDIFASRPVVSHLAYGYKAEPFAKSSNGNHLIRHMQTDSLLLDFPKKKDTRGVLTYIQESENIPFDIQRVFWIYNVAKGMERGKHAHRTCSEVIIPICGSFKISVSVDGINFIDYILDSLSQGLLIPPMVWCRLYDFSENSICLCLASEPYNKEGYINDLSEFIRIKASL